MGCSTATSLVARIKEIRRGTDPALLFVEPSEMAVTQELRTVAAMGLRDVRYETGPFITLVDGPSFQFSWEERRPLLLGQIAGADMVMVSRADLLDYGSQKEIIATLDAYTNVVETLSVVSGLGLEEVMKMIA